MATEGKNKKKHTQLFRAQADTCFNLTEIKLRLRFTMSLKTYNTNSSAERLLWIRLSFRIHTYDSICLHAVCGGVAAAVVATHTAHTRQRIYVWKERQRECAENDSM